MIEWTGKGHDCAEIASKHRDYAAIRLAACCGVEAVIHKSIDLLARTIRMSYSSQLNEGMEALPTIPEALAMKYCGAGWGGYALYLFRNERDRWFSGVMPVEPFMESNL